MTVKQILNLTEEELEKNITTKDIEKMKNLDIDYMWQLLKLLQDSVKEYQKKENCNENENYTTISDYLDYLSFKYLTWMDKPRKNKRI